MKDVDGEYEITWQKPKVRDESHGWRRQWELNSGGGKP